MILCCSTPDAPAEALDELLPAGVEVQVIATKSDLAVQESRAVLAVSSHNGAGLEALSLVEHNLAAQSGADPASRPCWLTQMRSG